MVKTTTRSWAMECAIADAADVLDRAEAGKVAVLNGQPYDRAYEFSNGRKFRDVILPKP